MPEQLNDLIVNNRNAQNLLACIGFNIQRTTTSAIRDQPDRQFIAFPDNRFMDLNMRSVHILSAIIELCFEQSYASSSVGHTTRTNTSSNNINNSNNNNDNNNNQQQDYAIKLDEASYINQFYQNVKMTSSSPSNSVRLDQSKNVDYEHDVENDQQGKHFNDIDEYKTHVIIYNLQALLPINDKHLLTCIVDIIALSKFSPEIVLSITDHSVSYALNYYEKLTVDGLTNLNGGYMWHHQQQPMPPAPSDAGEYHDLLDKEIDRWSTNAAHIRTVAALDNFERELLLLNNNTGNNNSANNRATASIIQNNSKNNNDQQALNCMFIGPTNHAIKFGINNKVTNFLFAIGFEIVGEWLRFNDIEFNRRCIEIMLKLFTSFALDRDMSLYKELNINVLGQRSAVTRDRYSRMRTASSLSNNDLTANNNDDPFRVLVF